MDHTILVFTTKVAENNIYQRNLDPSLFAKEVGFLLNKLNSNRLIVQSIPEIHYIHRVTGDPGIAYKRKVPSVIYEYLLKYYVSSMNT